MLGCIIYGYKLGADDSATMVYFSDAGVDYAHLKVLNKKGADSLRKFAEDDMALAISIHQDMNENQSVFSKFIGPESIRSEQREHYLNYYRGILEYEKQFPRKDNQSKALNDLEQLIKSLNDN